MPIPLAARPLKPGGERPRAVGALRHSRCRPGPPGGLSSLRVVQAPGRGLQPRRRTDGPTARGADRATLPSSSGERDRDRGRHGAARLAAASPDSAPTTAATSALRRVLPRWSAFLSALYQFSRPHTVAGTVVSVVSVSLLGLQGHPPNAAFTQALAYALVSAVLMNVHIVGLNQIFDVEIDKVNKPYLPLASGEFTMNTAVTIVSASAVLSLAVGLMSRSPPLLCTLAVSMLLGIVYSTDLPFLRWKQHPMLAAMCVMCIRAVMVQFGFYLHVRHSMGLMGLALSGHLLSTVFLMMFFAAVIAFFKDIPDVRGDRKVGVRTFSVRLGQKRMFWLCVWLLTAMYAGAVGVGLNAQSLWSRVLFPSAHVLMAAIMWRWAPRVDVDRKQDIVDFYMFIWKLFYMEYLFIPLLH
eukprot:evm.model.scf_83.4 EVM.evm.TU.scf_83.4   scf_83:128935-133570(-)